MSESKLLIETDRAFWWDLEKDKCRKGGNNDYLLIEEPGLANTVFLDSANEKTCR